MITPSDLFNTLKELNLKQVAVTSLKNKSEAYLDANRGQMLEGKGKNKNIGTYRNKQYASFKKELNSKAGLGNVDLKLTGSFQEGMTMTMNGDDIDVDSTDSKTGDLVNKYGGQIFGLNKGTQSTFVEETLQPSFEDEFSKETGLKFA